MPRRLVTSRLFQNDKVATLDFAGRYFFIGVITNADDDGRLKGSIKFLKANIFPYDNVSEEQILIYRDECHKLGIIYYYNVNGAEVIMLPGWVEHQNIRGDRYKPSTLPPPPDYYKTTRPSDNREATNGIPQVAKVNTADLPRDNLLQDDNEINRGIPSANQETTPGMLKISKDSLSKDNIIYNTSVGEVFKIFEANFQKITDINSQQLGDLIDTYGVDKVKDALKIAIKRNARNLAYVEGVLKPKKEYDQRKRYKRVN